MRTFADIEWRNMPAWGAMWLLAIAIFAICKLLTLYVEPRRLSTGTTLAYLFGWPGLNPTAFLRRRQHPEAVSLGRWLWASTKTVFGIVLIVIAVCLVPQNRPMIVGWTGMVGLVFLLHFGTFELLACLWRSVGYDVQPLMQAPHYSTSLVEFWSHRWNRAFRDFSNRLVLRPLIPKLGPIGAMWAVFLVSGLVHDLVISVPSRGGYGRPTAYFLLQAIGVVLQRGRWARTRCWDTGIGGWFVTALWLVVPLPLLFHEPFVVRVILPFLEAIRVHVMT